MEPWYKVATPRKEVREGRPFNSDEQSWSDGQGRIFKCHLLLSAESGKA
jgi:hypothetical protein